MTSVKNLRKLSFLVYGLGLSGKSVVNFFKKKKIQNFLVWDDKNKDLFLNKSKPISKDKILSSVWNYSSDADTHTVETHIYRLRKKINEKFSDDNFILNDKKGYSL